MEKATGKVYVKNGELLPVNTFQEENAHIGIYEAFRVYNGKPVFLFEHMERLKRSLSIYNLTSCKTDFLIDHVKVLIQENKIVSGNIKISLKHSNNRCNSYVYQLIHHYPTEEIYENGVHCIFYEAERHIPHAKTEQYSYKNTIHNSLAKHNAFDALLVDHNEHITEGTRTNVFFIKNNMLYSAPEADILQGVTRKYVLQNAKEQGIEYRELPIDYKALDTFEAAFLTGTSIQVLPIKSIASNKFDVSNTLLKALMLQFKVTIADLTQRFSW